LLESRTKNQESRLLFVLALESWLLDLNKKETQEDEAIGGCLTVKGRGHKSWQFTVGSKQFNLETANGGLQTIIKSRSSVWLEHYTDNVGVSSSNLLGTTGRRSRQWAVISYQWAVRNCKLRTGNCKLIN
jgi:hypothetical protein